ncbi:MAG: T9SS type A sorting domain-containing protein [bacterium]|nr:T9SS type A sorting domain-containing protein [bacterium]
MRFTPTKKGVCRVKAINTFSRVFRSTSTPTNTAYIYDDAGGVPGTSRTAKSYTPSVRAWDRIDFDTPIDYTSDFWLGIYLAHSNATDSIAIVLDNSLNYSGRTKAWNSDAAEWKEPPTMPGDFMIRAIVDYTGVEETSSNPILSLNQNYPNPVIKNTNISYTLPSETKVKLEIYNATGRVVKTLVNEVQSSGNKIMEWNKRNTSGEVVSSGIYFYRLTTGNKTITKTMIVL